MSTPARSRVSGVAGDTRSSSSRRNARRSSTTSAARRRLPSIFRVGCCPCSSWIGTRGLEPKFLQDFSEAERRVYVEANAAAVRALLPADLVFTNHVLMGGPVGAASGALFRVKAHGSELEDPMRGRPELGEWAREPRARAHADLRWLRAHSRSARRRAGDTDRVFDVPPGVDIDRFVLQDRGAALEDLLAEARKDPPNGGDERLPDDGNAQRLAAFPTGSGRSSFTSGS